MPLQPAVLGARLNNFRLNYLTAQQAAERPGAVWIILGGVEITKPTAPVRVIYKSLTIRDQLFDAPNTCSLTLYGAAAPTVGTPIEVWLNRNVPQLLFNGELQTVGRTYKGRPATVLHPVTAIDDTARANRRRPIVPFVTSTIDSIARALITLYAPGFSSAGVESGLPSVAINFDGSEAGMKGCLTALAKLCGASWYFENKTLYFFVTPPANPPDPINDTPKRFLDDPAITWSIDKSQVRTRVYGKGASTQIASSIAANEALIPLVNAEIFTATGGQAIAAQTPDGAASRIVSYTGVQLGGGGGLVGPGASPSAAPGLALADGAGMEAGAHSYAVTFTTAAGESLAGPAATITVGTTANPATSPVPGTPTAGGAVDAGTHYYAVTFVTASGETMYPNVGAGVTTTVGTGVPVPGVTNGALRNVIGNLANAVTYRYKTTFTTSSGESLPGAIGNSIVVTPPPFPSGPVAAYYDVTGSMAAGGYRYGLAYVAGGYETLMQTPGTYEVLSGPYNAVAFNWIEGSNDARVTVKRLYRTHVNGDNPGPFYLVAELPNTTTSYVDTKSDAQLGAQRSGTAAIGTPPGDQATVTIPTSADGRTVGRKIYRSDATAPYRYLATVNNNTATAYVDNTASVATQPDAPTSDTTGGASYQTVPLSGIAIGPANVTGRRIYRSFNAGPYKRVTTIANNTATTYSDTTANSALGAALPTANTATANQVTVTVPLGGSTVTGRKLYRTAANLSALKLQQTIANNTTTTITDTALDATLGAAPPVTDTSGLVQPSGQVAAGATSLILANPAPFAAGGGWAVIGNGDQVIRYTGKSGTALTGIPAAGFGAIVASISYNSTVTAAPALMGVTGLAEAVIRNSPIHVWVQRDDLAAQANMIALDGGGDGVYEHIWSDERRSEPSLRQVCDAQLKLYGRPLVSVAYATRDAKTKSGKPITIALSALGIYETLTIQDVTITELGIRGLQPKFTVTASSVQQSFEAILQMLIRKADA